MREVQIGGESVPLVASPWTLFVYSSEFGNKSDLVGDLMGFAGVVKTGATVADLDISQVQFITLYKIVWAMAKTAKAGLPFPSFEAWMQSVDLKVEDDEVWNVALEEATTGLFR